MLENVLLPKCCWVFLKSISKERKEIQLDIVHHDGCQMLSTDITEK